jgi:hypothetical protein
MTTNYAHVKHEFGYSVHSVAFEQVVGGASLLIIKADIEDKTTTTPTPAGALLEGQFEGQFSRSDFFRAVTSVRRTLRLTFIAEVIQYTGA